MRNANSPSGPGRPTNEVRDAVTEQEELDELIDGEDQAAGDSGSERRARNAERGAVTPGKSVGDGSNGPG